MDLLSALRSNPQETLIILLYQIPAILIALTLHEVSHGYVAYRCGDPTARMMGRLSLNPLKHLDPIGTLCMVLFRVGWARPVPVNPRNFKRCRRDDFLVSIAGITMNFCLFFLSMLLMTGIVRFAFSQDMWNQGPLATYRDFLSFDGWNFYSILSGENKLFVSAQGGIWYYQNSLQSYMRAPWLLYVLRFIMFFSRINLNLALFNLLPIPPLDGYHLVNDIFLRGRLHIPPKVMNALMIAMLALFYFTSVISAVISAAVEFVQGGVLSAILWIFGLE